MDKFVVEPTWQLLFKDIGLSAQDVLRQAQLPLDLFTQKSATLTTDEYFRIMECSRRTL